MKVQVSLIKKLQAKLLVSLASNALANKGTCTFTSQKIAEALECTEIELHGICALANSTSKNGVECEYLQEKKIVNIKKDTSMLERQSWAVLELFNKKMGSEAKMSEQRQKLIISYIKKYDYIQVITAIEGASLDNWFRSNGMSFDFIFKSESNFESFVQKALKAVNKIIAARGINRGN